MRTLLIFTFSISTLLSNYAMAMPDVESEMMLVQASTSDTSNYGTQKQTGYGYAWCRAWVTCRDGRTLNCEARSGSAALCEAKKAKYVECTAYGPGGAAYNDYCN
jgi:hypothetical protein